MVEEIKNWLPPKSWTTVSTIDLHTAGEPLRVIFHGLPDFPGDTLLSRRLFIKENFDYFRTLLMGEPRGHTDMYGCFLTPPVSREADIGIIFMHNEGYSTMCGHGIIGVATMVLETKMVSMKEPVTILKIDTPAGLVTAYCRIANKRDIAANAWFLC